MMKLLLGGSPCTHWSIAQTKNRETKPEGLGWELFKNYLIALEKYKPDYFLYENNKSMSAAIREQITRELGVEPIEINSALVSAQNRKRLYWTNISGVEQPEDCGILLRDILETTICENGYTLKPFEKSLTEREMDYMVREVSDGRNHFDFDFHHDATKEKSSCVTANTHRGVPYNVLVEPVNTTVGGKAQCLRATCYKDGVRNMVGNAIDRKTCVAEPVRIGTVESGEKSYRQDSQAIRVYSPDGKSVTLSAGGGGQGGKTGLYAVPESGKKAHPVYEVRNGFITIKGRQYPIKLSDGFYIIRKLTVRECMRLQTIPEGYIFPVSDTQAYKMLGNGWTVDVIAHILSYCPGIRTKPLEVLSMYDGMSCGHLALDKLGGETVRYFAAEIDKYAIKTTQANFPDTIQIGDAFQVRNEDWSLTGKG